MSVKSLKNEDIYLVKVDNKEDIEELAGAVDEINTDSIVEEPVDAEENPVETNSKDITNDPIEYGVEEVVEQDIDPDFNDVTDEGEEALEEDIDEADLISMEDVVEVESDPLESLPVIDNDGPLFQLAMQAMVDYHNIAVLHHNIVGGAWYGNHEQLDEYYGYIGDFVDDLIEQNIELGGREPSIAESVSVCGCINVVRRNKNETFNVCRGIFNNLVTMIEECKDRVPSDVISKLEEYQNYFRKEAEYKINLLLKGE